MKKGANTGLCLAIIAGVFSPLLVTFAQEVAPTPQTAAQPVVTAVEVIVTGSNIPTAEEVDPLPVDTYRKADIERLGVRSATDFVQKLPIATGAAINENLTNGGDGRTEVNLRGILPKETLVLQDGRRLAPVGFAGDTVDLNMFPFGLIDHIDILKDGASAIYGSDAVDLRSTNYAGHVGQFVNQPSLNGGARSPTPHAFPNLFNDPQYVPVSRLPRKQQAFNFNALTPAMASVDREYLYGSLDTKVS